MTDEKTVLIARVAHLERQLAECQARESEVRAYAARLERALDYIGVSDSGGELFPVGPSDTEYAEDGNTVIRRIGPWHFLNGKGETFLDAVEDQMRMDDAPNASNE